MAVAESVGSVLGARETSRYPPTVLRTRRAAHLRAPVRLRCGGGAAHDHPQGRSLPIEEREQVSKQTRRGRAQRLWAHERSETQCYSVAKHGRQAGPLGTQCGRRLTCSPPLSTEECVHIEHRGTPQQVVHRTGEVMGADGQRFARAMLCLSAGEDTCGPQDGCAGPGPPLPSRPM